MSLDEDREKARDSERLLHQAAQVWPGLQWKSKDAGNVGAERHVPRRLVHIDLPAANLNGQSHLNPLTAVMELHWSLLCWVSVFDQYFLTLPALLSEEW